MTNNLIHILDQYNNLKKELDSLDNQHVIEQIIKLQTLLHNLFEEDLFNFIPSLKEDLDDIFKHLNLENFSYKVNNKNQLILIQNDVESIHNMYSTNELINLMSSENLTKNQLDLTNLYLSESSIFVALNLYFLQNS